MCIFMVIYEKNKPILYHNSSKEEIMLVLLLLEEGRRHYGRRKAYSKKKCSIIFSFVLKLLLLYHPLPLLLLCVLKTHPSAQYSRTNTHSFSVFIFYSTIHYILCRWRRGMLCISKLSKFHAAYFFGNSISLLFLTPHFYCKNPFLIYKKLNYLWNLNCFFTFIKTI